MPAFGHINRKKPAGNSDGFPAFMGGGRMPLLYDREAAVAYAHRWAMGRNPAYLDFHGIGGDCTNVGS